MTLRGLTLSVATAALLSTGAIAQDNSNTDAAQSADQAAETQTMDQNNQDAMGEKAADSQTGDSMNQDSASEQAADTQSEDQMDEASTDQAAASDAQDKSEMGKFVSRLDADQMPVSRITGTAVQNTAGEQLGDVNDLIVNQKGKPAVAIIGVGGFLGIGEKAVGVPFEQLEFSMTEDNERVVRLDTTRAALESAPTFVYEDDAATN